jgi:Uma2 family endonuclease
MSKEYFMAAQPANLPSRHRLTVSDYHRMGETGILRPGNRTELINGEIIDMAPIGSRHGSAVKKLIQFLTLATRGRAIVSAQDPVLLAPFSEPQPDLMLLKPRTDFYAAEHPKPDGVLLVIEVADTTLRNDRDIKVPLYARHGLPEVWLVDLESRLLHAFRAPSDDGYAECETFDKPGAIAPRLLPDCDVELSGLF